MARKSLTRPRSPLLPSKRPALSPCFEVEDSSTIRISAAGLVRGTQPREVAPQAARLASQFVRLNKGALAAVGASVSPQFDGSSVSLSIQAGATIGAIPLVSPTTGRADYGLVIRPRFDWRGIGTMLGEMGWRVVPSILNMPMLPRSERRVPPWVLSSILLQRLEALLSQLQRQFETTFEIRTAPRGRIDWGDYATRRLPRGSFLEVPCHFPDLRDDRELKAAIHYCLNKIRDGLESQRTAGAFVLQLIDLCANLTERVRAVPPKQPHPSHIQAWERGAAIATESYQRGLQAIEWVTDDRGLAGLSDLQGLPWMISMDKFFEAWGEAILESVAQKVGGVLRAGRRNQTIAPLAWSPPYLGSQRYLLPDLVLERGDWTLIVDAKYKHHWEELQHNRWTDLGDELRERHRDDILQVLAYANLSTSKRTIVCLAYPCQRTTWDSLRERGRLFHRASLNAGERSIELLLTAFPMGVQREVIAAQVARQVA